MEVSREQACGIVAKVCSSAWVSGSKCSIMCGGGGMPANILCTPGPSPFSPKYDRRGSLAKGVLSAW
jgi:hypothetical protein